MLMSVLLVLLLACNPKASSDTADTDLDASGDTDTGLGTGDPLLLCNIGLVCEGNILDNPKVPCAMEVVSGDGVALYDGPAGVELRGRTTLTSPKPQYSVDLHNYGELPIWPGFIWHFLDDGANLGTAWRAPAYDDASWSVGPAPLGYGEDYLNTEVSSGPDPDAVTVTTYYRYTFGVYTPASITKLTVGLIRNDGAAVYLNGTEILRDNLPADASYDTLALAPISAADEVLWTTADVPTELLLAEGNVLAVEVHQASLTSTDSRFDLYLEGAGGDAAVDMLGMGRDSDWIVNGQYLDRVLFRNKLVYDLFQSLGGPERYASETRFCELTLDGDYKGVYTLGERIERETTRVDISNEGEPGESFIVKLDDVDGFHANAVGYGTWQLVDPKDTPDAEARVSAYLTQWEEAILGPDPADPDTGVFAYLDMDSAVDFVLLQEFAKNMDAYQLSVYLWKDTEGKMFFAPWDLDLSFGYPYYDCSAEGWLVRAPWVDAMASDPAFHDALVARWTDLRQGPLAEDAILERIAGYDLTLGAAVERNFERWPIEDIAYETDFVEDWLCPVSTYPEEHARVLDFISGRLAWMDANIGAF